MKKVLIALFVILLVSCSKSQDQVPNVAVDFYIYLNEPAYVALNVPGNFVYVTGGYKGIIVYRENFDLFRAYDRTCTFDPYVTASIVTVDTSGLGLSDLHCGSKFNILDGSVVRSPATRPLKQYVADYDGANIVHVHSY